MHEMRTTAIDISGGLSVCVTRLYMTSLCKHSWTDRGLAWVGAQWEPKKHRIKWRSRFSSIIRCDFRQITLAICCVIGEGLSFKAWNGANTTGRISSQSGPEDLPLSGTAERVIGTYPTRTRGPQLWKKAVPKLKCNWWRHQIIYI